MGERGFYEPVKVSDVNEGYVPDVEPSRDAGVNGAVAFAGVLLVIDILIGVACLVVSIAK